MTGDKADWYKGVERKKCISAEVKDMVGNIGSR
jgi:hypothetical protein